MIILDDTTASTTWDIWYEVESILYSASGNYVITYESK